MAPGPADAEALRRTQLPVKAAARGGVQLGHSEQGERRHEVRLRWALGHMGPPWMGKQLGLSPHTSCK